MKPAKKAILLACAAMVIVFFWILPGINEGKEPRYVRYYEDTDEEKYSGVIQTVAYHGSDTTQKRHRKAMKKEVIEPRKTRKVSPKIFSRAMQFEPLIESDSILELAERDSLSVVQ